MIEDEVIGARVLMRWGYGYTEGTVVAETDDKVKVEWDEVPLSVRHLLMPVWVAKSQVDEVRS